MKRALVVPAAMLAVLGTASVAQAGTRDVPRPSRSEAPARFGTVAYFQWYAQQAAAIRYGWNGKQFAALKWIWFHESGWNYKAVNRSSGATGIAQALPASKMRTYGADYRTNPETQIDWGLDYIKTRYGTPIKAKQFWLRHHWY